MGECFVEGLGGIKEWECLHRATGTYSGIPNQGVVLNTPAEAILISEYDELLLKLSVSGAASSNYGFYVGAPMGHAIIALRSELNTAGTGCGILKKHGVSLSGSTNIYSFCFTSAVNSTTGVQSQSNNVFGVTGGAQLAGLALVAWSNSSDITANFSWTYAIYGKKYYLP